MTPEGKRLLERIREDYSELSGSYRKIARYISDNYRDVAFLTAAKVAEQAGVSESVVVRFASRIGYSGYPEMQQIIIGAVRAELSPAERLGQKGKYDLEGSSPAELAFRRDKENLALTEHNLSLDSVRQAAQKIAEAHRVWVIGMIESAAVAKLLGTLLSYIVPEVTIVEHDGMETVVPLKKVGPRDVVIGISFPRYALQTIRAIEYCKGKGATIIALTDSTVAPAAETASICLVCNVDMISFFNSYTAVISVINALLVELVSCSTNRVKEELLDLDQSLNKFGAFFVEGGSRFKGFIEGSERTTSKRRSSGDLGLKRLRRLGNG